MAKLKFDREATLERFLKPIPKGYTKDSLLGVMDTIDAERQAMRKALEHISNTSNNYESKYAKRVLEELFKQ